MLVYIGPLMGIGVLHAQQTEAKRCIKITTKNGISSPFSKKIFEDSNGYIWICTQDGLNRYDGRSFVIYRKDAPTPFKLQGNDVNDIAEDTAAKRLWVISSSGGIAAIDTRTYEVVQRATLFSRIPGKIIWLKNLEQHDGQLWLGTDEGLFRYQPAEDRFTYIKFPWYAAGMLPEVDAMATAKGGCLWIGFADGTLAAMNLSTLRVVFTDRRFYSNTFHPTSFLTFSSIEAKNPEEILITASAGLFSVYPAKNFQVKEHALGFLPQNALPLYSASFVAGACWVATAKGMYAVYPDGQWSLIIDNELGNSDNWYRRTIDIFEDHAKNIWLSVPNGVVLIPGMHPYFQNYFISSDSDVKINRSLVLFPLSKDLIYAACDDGFYEVHAPTHRIRKLIHDQAVFCVDTIPGGTLLVCKAEGVDVLQSSGKRVPVSVQYPGLKTLDTLAINSIVRFGDSLVYFCLESAGEVLEWRIKANTLKPLAFEKQYNISTGGLLNGLAKTGPQELCILGDDALYRVNISSGKVDKKQFKDPKTGQPAKYYFDIARDDVYYYLAIYDGGILQLDSNLNLISTFTSKYKVQIPGVYKVVVTPENQLLVTTNNGLYFFNIAKEQKGYKILYESHGLQTHQFEECCATYSNGRVYAGGINGFQVFDTDVTRHIFPPTPVALNAARIFYTNNTTDAHNLLQIKKLQVRPRFYNIVIDAALPAFGDADYIGFSYRLNAPKGEWIDNGSDQTIRFSELAPGDYTLQVKAQTPLHGTLYSAILPVTVMPHWYQTIWFYAAILTIAMLLFYALYRYRVWQIQKETNIRTQLAADLHDDLGGTLTGLKLYADMGISSNSPEYFLPVKNGLKDVTHALFEMIWVLDNKTNSAADIITRIEKSMIPVLQASDIDLLIKQDDGLAQLNIKNDEKRNLYLMLKEFINNSVKYAQCQTIRLEGRIKKRRMYIRISDDGKGFDMQQLQRGNGLNNIETRARQMGYRAQWNTAPGKGVMLELIPE